MIDTSSAPLSPRAVLSLVCLVAALIGLNFSILKFALDHSSPLLLAGMRTVIGGTALLAFARWQGERLPRRAIDYGRIFIVGFNVDEIPVR